MHQRLVRQVVGFALLACALAAPCSARAQAGPRADALELVADVMILRRGALGDTAPYDACSIHEQTGRPVDFPAGLRPGLIPLLDRTGADPCAHEAGSESRSADFVRVDSVRLGDSTAAVHLSIRRGEWRYKEDYYFSRLGSGRGWGFRQSRMTHPLRITREPVSPSSPPPR